MPGVLNFLLNQDADQMKNVLQNPRGQVAQSKLNRELETDHLKRWGNEALVLCDVGQEIGIGTAKSLHDGTTIYPIYNEWTKQEGLSFPVSLQSFSGQIISLLNQHDLKPAGYEPTKKRKNTGNIIVGIRLRN